MSEPREVLIRDLLRDRQFQVREALSQPVVQSYAHVLSAGNELPPILVASINGALVVLDGWHRIAAHERRGRSSVMARVVEANASEAQWLAAEANLRHGLRLKGREIRTAFRAFINARRHLRPAERRDGPRRLLSYREIATALGGVVAHTTIRHWMQLDFPNIARRMGGEAAPMDNEAPGPEADEDALLRAAQDAIRQALVAARGVRDPGKRGFIVGAAKDALRELERGGAWHPAEF